MKHFFLNMTMFLSLGVSAQKGQYAFINGTCHQGNGSVINNCLLVVKGDRILSVHDIKGIRIDPRAYDTIIDLEGKHIYPALINPNNVLGLHDAEAVRATVDFAEVGAYNPHVRSLIAYNTDNPIIPTVRSNGVLYSQVTPRNGIISGASSVMALSGWNWEDAVLMADDGIHLNYPAVVYKRRGEDEKKFRERQKKWQEEINQLNTFFSDAQAYHRNPAIEEKNIRFEAMRPVFTGKARLYLHADHARDIMACLGFVKRFSIQRAVLVGGREAHRFSSELRTAKIPVILGRVNELPEHTDDDVDLVFSLPYMLQRDSVLFCLQLEGDMEAMQSRNLSFNAGSAVAYGLNKEQALAAITLNAAKIIGVDHLIGSVEEGKLASFIISTGDILDIRSNQIVMAYIAGKPVDLANRQQELYLRYKNKYGK